MKSYRRKRSYRMRKNKRHSNKKYTYRNMKKRGGGNNSQPNVDELNTLVPGTVPFENEEKNLNTQETALAVEGALSGGKTRKTQRRRRTHSRRY